jgi:hypothetical protein
MCLLHRRPFGLQSNHLGAVDSLGFEILNKILQVPNSFTDLKAIGRDFFGVFGDLLQNGEGIIELLASFDASMVRLFMSLEE